MPNDVSSIPTDEMRAPAISTARPLNLVKSKPTGGALSPCYPGTMQSQVEHQDMIKKRHENQVNLSLKKGRVAVDEFLVNDRVVIQNNLNGKWEEEGVIIASRLADDHSLSVSLPILR